MLRRSPNGKLEAVLFRAELLFDEGGYPLPDALDVLDETRRYSGQIAVYPLVDIKNHRLRRRIKMPDEDIIPRYAEDSHALQSKLLKSMSRANPAKSALVEKRRAGLIGGFWSDIGQLIAVDCSIEDTDRVPRHVDSADSIVTVPALLAGFLELHRRIATQAESPELPGQALAN